MIAAKIAANAINEMFEKNNFSEAACRAYGNINFNQFKLI